VFPEVESTSKHAVVHFEDRDIERAAAEIVNAIRSTLDLPSRSERRAVGSLMMRSISGRDLAGVFVACRCVSSK
jgi:hypothetical protein